MRFLLLYILFFAAAYTAQGKVFINHPAAKEGEEVWFRSSFELEELPDSASLAITTSGYVLAYINGRITFPEIIWPYRPLQSTTERGDSLPPLRQYASGMASRDINIRPLLHKGTNIIALWYAPCVNAKALAESEEWEAMPDSLKGQLNCSSVSIHQVSPVITVTHDEKRKEIVTPESAWLCHIASGKITTYGEEMYATEYIDDWKSIDFTFNATWIPAEKTWAEMMEWNTLQNDALCFGRIIDAQRNQSSMSEQTYYFPYEVSGLLRITLRGVTKGQQITVNGMRYKCLGIEDEQMFTRFATITTDSVTIVNESANPFPDIQGVEMIELKQGNIGY